jgi:hypothetical protein
VAGPLGWTVETSESTEQERKMRKEKINQRKWKY